MWHLLPLLLALVPLLGCGVASPERLRNVLPEQESVSEKRQICSETAVYPPYDRVAEQISFLRELESKGTSTTALQTIQKNIERWKNLSVLEDQYLEVNIPSFTLSVFKGPRVSESYRVIVGKPSDPTPILRGEVSYLELNPYWEVPHQIAVKEILPELKKNRNYLAKNHMELFSLEGERLDPSLVNWIAIDGRNFRYHIHQVPGPWCAVGKIKFVFPNQYSVYLHGTPNQNLFEKERRCFSHGCVRVENPLSVASFLLQDTEWTEEKIQTAIDSGKTRRIVLKKPMPIYLSYWTVSVDPDGAISYSPDVYGLDAP